MLYCLDLVMGIRDLFLDFGKASVSRSFLYCSIFKNAKKELKMCMDIMADPQNHSVVFHCEHGKDRTGIIAALVLLSANAPTEEIGKDYYESEKFTRSAEYVTTTESKGIPLKVVGPCGFAFILTLDYREFVAAHPAECIITALDFVTQLGYKDAVDYMENIGVDAAARKRIRDSLLVTISAEPATRQLPESGQVSAEHHDIAAKDHVVDIAAGAS